MLDRLSVSVRDQLEQVEHHLREEFISSVPEATEVTRYVIGGGGKRLRPAIFLLAAGAAQAKNDGLPQLATAIEMIHTASLMHDDVIDEAMMRRGLPPARARWGDKASILAGDLLCCRASQILLRHGDWRVLGEVFRAVAATTEGQILELHHMRDSSTSKETYLEIIRHKTAALFSLAARMGSIVAGAPKPAEAALSDYGADVGIAFQLVDDVLDFVSDTVQLGKACGSDLQEGKLTYPLIAALELASAAEGELIRKALTKRGDIFPSPFQEVKDILIRSGAIDATLELARQTATRAKGHLSALIPGEDHQGLAAVADYVVGRAG
jgi:octaprenyl-diphosphate synthase